MLATTGRHPEAVRLLEAHLLAHPESLESRRMLVRVLGATGDVGAAERQVEELARRSGPGSPLPWVELGHVMELSHRYEEALALYDRASAAAPADPTGPRVGGLRAARWGEPELARPRLEEAVKRDPEDAEAWHALGLVRLHLDDPRGARRAYQAALRAAPHAAENELGLASAALALDEPGVALRHYDRVLRSRPGYTDARLGRSWALILVGRYDEARKALAASREHGADRHVISAQLRLLADLEAKRPKRR